MNNNKPLVPELRFPEFRNKSEWSNTILGQLCTITTGKLDANAMIENGQYRFYTCAKNYYWIDKYAFDTEALLISGNGANVGYIHYYNGKFNAYQRTYVLDKFDSYISFIKFNLEQNLHKRIEIEKMDGNTPYIVMSTLAEMKIILPDRNEQQKVADCLSSLDELITAHTQKHQTLQLYKKGLMQNLFPAEGETVPELRFPEFRGKVEWIVEQLGDKTIKVGSGITPKGGDKNYLKSGIPFVRSQNIGWGCFILQDIAYIDEITHSRFSSTEINEGDVLLNITGASIGRCAVADQRVVGGNVNQHVCIIRTKKKSLQPYFLNQFILSSDGQYQIDSFQAGGNRQGLNFSQIKSFLIPISGLIEEQQKIADCLSSLDDLIAAQAQKIESLKLHKKGLMQQLFPVVDEASV